MSPALANFLFEAANFLLLAGVLGYVLFKPVRKVLDEERRRHTTLIEDAEHMRTEAETLAVEARAERQAAAHDAAARRQELLAAARAEAAAFVDEARAEQEAARHSLERQLRDEHDAAVLALGDTLGRVAATSVARLLETLDGPSLDLALTRAACAELGRDARPPQSPAMVESARPLDAASRTLLQATLGAGFAERTVDELGAGVRITTPSGQVDATAAGLARHAARMVIAAARSAGGTGG